LLIGLQAGISSSSLVVEIVAGRMIAPYVGMSLYTWTSIIAVVLAGFSVGHWWGGRIAGRETARAGVVWVNDAPGGDEPLISLSPGGDLQLFGIAAGGANAALNHRDRLLRRSDGAGGQARRHGFRSGRVHAPGAIHDDGDGGQWRELYSNAPESIHVHS